MKNFFINILVLLMILIGYTGVRFWFMIGEVQWYMSALGLIASFFLGIPAVRWWDNYFKNIFNSKNELNKSKQP